MIGVHCASCGLPLPPIGLPYRCPSCGGIYELADTDLAQASIAVHETPGIWRFPGMIDLGVEPVSLGEGETPLLRLRYRGRDVFVKCEYANPTGSFKDRGMAALTAVIRARGIGTVVEDSSGNAGASLAAYAARSGIRVRIYAPETVSGPKAAQIRKHGAELVLVPGARRNASEAAVLAVAAGAIYASHAYSPFCMLGYESCADEILGQLGRLPTAVILPVGQGGLLLGLARGFRRLRRSARSPSEPALVGVQAAACAPFCGPLAGAADGVETLAEGIRVAHPVRRSAVENAVRASGGRFFACGEDEILAGRDRLAKLGFYVEATSAVIWGALEETLETYPDPVVVVLTGSGLKARLGDS